MASQRRLRVIVYLVLAGVVMLLFFTSRARHARNADLRSQDFHSKTVNAIVKDHGVASSGGQKPIAGHDADADEDVDQEDALIAKQMADRLRQAEQKAKDSAKAKGPNKPEAPAEVIGVGSSASGQEKPAPKPKAGTGAEQTKDEDPEVEEVLTTILKQSPIIIFSKSYCPFSQRAKGILLEKYVIEPAPYVVELDLHPLGAKIQARVGVMTGRATVPNIMVFGNSIGGGDEIAALDTQKGLGDKITAFGGSRVSVSLRFAQSAQKAA
ncbi:thioredoxin-like protein [Chaetomidium leptoderma]|uniref:Thioredoxin-like protein n=1 Tax=Chaetomidium leptoderma TaxID=669021 RepID=A0AAN6ZVX5_9PEZI|nr:thioredoxin-like protein [Chaetomidium leptoderma]